MFFQLPRRRLHNIDGIWHSFGRLDRVMPWPDRFTEPLRVALTRPGETDPLCLLLLEQGVLSRHETDDELFPLTRLSTHSWGNSQRCRRWSEAACHPLTVLDGLNWQELHRLPRGTGLLYLGDTGGGFWAPQTSTPDGKIPCARCLMRRYLAGRQASPALYHALRQGASVAFEQNLPELDLAAPGLVCWSARGQQRVEEVLPVPDCADCVATTSIAHLPIDLFSPITRLTSQGVNHAASLSQVIWLCGVETVGHGGARDEDPDRGRARALNEALERYAAHFLPAESASTQVAFQSPEGPRFMSLQKTLLREPGSLSSGLACRETLEQAIADGLQEVCERDALARFWLDLQEKNCHVMLHERTRRDGLDLETWQLDSYFHPTVLCVGRTENGAVTGSACGSEPRAKAVNECLQNAAYLAATPQREFSDPPESFEDHLRAAWTGRYQIPQLQAFSVKQMAPRELPGPVCHRDLTPADLARLSRHAVRVCVPGLLAPPMSHHDWPSVLGGSRKPPTQPHPFG